MLQALCIFLNWPGGQGTECINYHLVLIVCNGDGGDDGGVIEASCLVRSFLMDSA